MAGPRNVMEIDAVNDSTAGAPATFRPQFAYPLGRGDDAPWIAFSCMTLADGERAAEFIPDRAHRGEFEGFLNAHREQLADGKTLGELLGR